MSNDKVTIQRLHQEKVSTQKKLDSGVLRELRFVVCEKCELTTCMGCSLAPTEGVSEIISVEVQNTKDTLVEDWCSVPELKKGLGNLCGGVTCDNSCEVCVLYNLFSKYKDK